MLPTPLMECEMFRNNSSQIDHSVDSERLESALQMQSQIEHYRQKLVGGLTAIKEIENVMGDSFIPRLLRTVCGMVKADLSGSDRPASMLLSFLPKSVSAKVDAMVSFGCIAVQTGIIPMDWVDAIINDEQEARQFCDKVRMLFNVRHNLNSNK